jgi:exopolysaccharide biosynthesis polyprenyl glycosylphosphotransferase
MTAHATHGLYRAMPGNPEFRRTYWSTRVRSRKAIAEAIILSVTDFALVWLGATIALWFRLDAGAIPYGMMLAKNAGFLMLLSVLIILFSHVQGLYELQPRTHLEEAAAALKAVGLATVVFSASLYLSGERVVSRVGLGITVMTAAILLVSWRQVRRHRIAARAAAGQDCRHVLVIGWSHPAEVLHRYCIERRLPGYVLKGYLDRRKRGESNANRVERRSAHMSNVMGHIDELSNVVRAHFIDELLIFLPEKRELVKQLISDAKRLGINLRVVPDTYDGLAWGAPIEHFGPFSAIQIHERPIPVLGMILKRAVDVVGSACALLVMLPLSIVIALAIRLDSPGPVVYQSTRIGRKGITFTCYKFRTMIQNAENMRNQLDDLNERSGLLFKISNDPRITRVGRILRKYSIDEIPQFWNVLCGDMSLVGPRPPVPGEYRQYELGHFKRLHVTPGITGLWQVEARTDPSFESYINLDNHYVDHWSVWLDLKILLKTVTVVFAGTGR